MPSKEKHIQQWKKNLHLAQSSLLRKPEYKDWRIITIFYAALHCLDSSYAHLAHPKTHTKRNEFLNSLSDYECIMDDYENLEMLSRKSRYDCIEILDKEVNDALINFSAIENFVKSKSNK